jgi:hypothetical protein
VERGGVEACDEGRERKGTKKVGVKFFRRRVSPGALAAALDHLLGTSKARP